VVASNGKIYISRCLLGAVSPTGSVGASVCLRQPEVATGDPHPQTPGDRFCAVPSSVMTSMLFLFCLVAYRFQILFDRLPLLHFFSGGSVLLVLLFL